MVSVIMPCFIRMRMPRVKPTTSMEETMDLVDSMKVLQMSVAE